MMAEMRSDGVALGSRNKLRLLVATASIGTGASSVGPRRAQALLAEESGSRTGRQDDSTPTARQHASAHDSTNERTSTIFGISGDSAPRVPQL